LNDTYNKTPLNIDIISSSSKRSEDDAIVVEDELVDSFLVGFTDFDEALNGITDSSP
jgi:hypothetical protein